MFSKQNYTEIFVSLEIVTVYNEGSLKYLVVILTSPLESPRCLIRGGDRNIYIISGDDKSTIHTFSENKKIPHNRSVVCCRVHHFVGKKLSKNIGSKFNFECYRLPWSLRLSYFELDGK